VAVLLEHEALVMGEAIAHDTPCAVRVGGPVRYRDRLRLRFGCGGGICVLGLGCRVLGDHVVRDHSARITDVQTAWEVIVIGEFVEAIAEVRPGFADGGLKVRF
jgi:hypothetical protein